MLLAPAYHTPHTTLGVPDVHTTRVCRLRSWPALQNAGRRFENIAEMEVLFKQYNIPYVILGKHGTFAEQVSGDGVVKMRGEWAGVCVGGGGGGRPRLVSCCLVPHLPPSVLADIQCLPQQLE